MEDLAGLAVLVAVLAPARLVHGGPVLCPVRRLTGLPCPTCGLTRSWHSAARLDLAASIGQHPLGPLALAGALALATRDEGEALPAWTGSHAVRVALGAAWIGVWLIRVRRAWRGRARRRRAAGGATSGQPIASRPT